MPEKPDFVFDDLERKNMADSWNDLCKTVHHAFHYGLHCNDMTHGEVEDDISFALSLFASTYHLPEHDWDADYDEMYPVEDADA